MTRDVPNTRGTQNVQAASGTSTTTGKGLPPRSMAEGQGPMDASDGFFAGPSGRHGAGMQHGSFGTPGVVKEDDWTEALRALVDEPNSTPHLPLSSVHIPYGR